MKKAHRPFLSIVIPVLNEEVCLPKLLKELAKQNYSNFEVLIVDAMSEDSTLKKAGTFTNKLPGFKLLSSVKRNVVYQRNLGAKKAKGKFVVFMDADISISFDFLDQLFSILEKTQPDILTTKFTTSYKMAKERVVAIFTNALLTLMNIIKNPIIIESMMVVKKKSFDQLKGFDEKCHNDEGIDLVRRAKINEMRYIFCNQPRYKFSYRRAHNYGFLRVGLNVAKIEIMRILKINLEWDKAEKLYPMQGGSFYKREKQL